MSETNDILSYLSLHKKRFYEEYHITSIGLFGSMVKGQQNSQSDIDLVIDFKANTLGLYELKNQLKREIEMQFNRQVDICRLKYMNPFIKQKIESEIKFV